MSRYDKMLELNKRASEQKIAQAKKAIFALIDEREKVTVPKLMQKTGLSRGFFYKNQIVREELERVMSQQGGTSHPRKKILDIAMDNEIVAMQRQLRNLQREYEDLLKENEKLKKALERKNRELLRNL